MNDEDRARIDEELGLAWLRDIIHADETDPDEPTDNGHARAVMTAIEKRDAENARLRSALAAAERERDEARREFAFAFGHATLAAETRDAALADRDAMRAVVNAAKRWRREDLSQEDHEAASLALDRAIDALNGTERKEAADGK